MALFGRFSPGRMDERRKRMTLVIGLLIVLGMTPVAVFVFKKATDVGMEPYLLERGFRYKAGGRRRS